MVAVRPLHLHAGVLQVVEPGRMRGEEMIVVEAVLDEQLPVRLDVVFLRALYDLHPARLGLVQDKIDVFPRPGEILRQWGSMRIEIQEDESAIAFHPRRLGEPIVGFPEARRIRALSGDTVEPAVAVVAPAVIEAGVVSGVAFGFAAHPRAAMAAGIEEHAHRTRAVAAENHRSAADRSRLEVAGK